MNGIHRASHARLAVLALAYLVGVLHAEQESGPVRVYKSRRFILHTDLPAGEAAERLARMEAVLESASRYWRRAPRGRVHCYLVGDLQEWPDAALPHLLARVWVGKLGGATIGELIREEQRLRPNATIYSAARSGIVEHEVIHAYCSQTFSEMGPDWYKEGMADVVSLRADRGRGVACSADRIAILRHSAPRTVEQIVAAERFTHGISASLDAMLSRARVDRHVPLSDWTQDDAERLDDVEVTYAWSWALCHMMVHNPNYAHRFRALGTAYLRSTGSFGDAFSAMSKELEFELAFFVGRIDMGYRVDLCSWDWHKRFRGLDEGPPLQTRVSASRGFQPSGLRVTAGRRYRFIADGSWSTSEGGDATDADGTEQGPGQLVGVVMRDFRLSDPFVLGARGEFVAPVSGRLYLRCGDAWNALADNSGELHVRFQP